MARSSARSARTPSRLYLLGVLEDAGNPTDPIERMLVEQICLAHHNIGRLHVKAASADHPEEARVYARGGRAPDWRVPPMCPRVEELPGAGRAPGAASPRGSNAPAPGRRERRPTAKGPTANWEASREATSMAETPSPSSEPAAGRGRRGGTGPSGAGSPTPGVSGCGRRRWPAGPGSTRPGRGRPRARPGPRPMAGQPERAAVGPGAAGRDGRGPPADRADAGPAGSAGRPARRFGVHRLSRGPPGEPSE